MAVQTLPGRDPTSFGRRRVSPPIVALIGAGASKSAGAFGDDAPPLTRELFSTPRALKLLGRDRAARAAASALEALMEDAVDSDETLAFEAALRRLQTDGHSHHRSYAEAVPPFLQELMLEYSLALSPLQRRYDRLVDRLLQATESVTFVSLNYDVLLDSHLDALRPLGSLNAYLPQTNRSSILQDGRLRPSGGGWALVKPHGSVSWFHEVDFMGQPSALKCTAIDDLDLSTLRRSDRLPALALPVGEKDELVCPRSHLDFLRRQLAEPEIDLLVLGYSAIDTEILGLVRSGGCRIRRLTVVNRGPHAALGVMRRLHEFGLRAEWPDVPAASYAEWVDGPGLRTWVQEYETRFESIVEPEAARTAVLRDWGDAGRWNELTSEYMHPMDGLCRA